MAAMTHAGAVVPQLKLAGDTHYVWLVEGADIIQGPNIPIREGKVRVPKGAGVGVDLDRDRLARAHEIYQKCGMRERDDVTTNEADAARLGPHSTVGYCRRDVLIVKSRRIRAIPGRSVPEQKRLTRRRRTGLPPPRKFPIPNPTQMCYRGRGRPRGQSVPATQ